MDRARDNLDRLIDSALASYSDAGPLAGLEQRVLNRVRVARARRRLFAWGLGFAVAASVAVVGIVIRTEPRPVAKPAEVARVTNAGPPATPTRPEPRIRRPTRAKRPKALPKLEQFPAPAPLTAEERALLALVEHHPEEAQLFADLQKRAEEPIEIQPIHIAPLRDDGAQ